MRVWLLLFFVACGSAPSSDDGGVEAGIERFDAASPDASEGDVGPFVTASHPPLPQEVTGGGAVLDAPKVVVITYDGDPFRDQLEDFNAKIGATKFWHDVTAEYGVGPLVAGRPVHLSDAPPTSIDDVDMKKWFATMLDGTHPEFDAPDDETMYILYFPAGTTYTIGPWTGCKEFGASDNLGQQGNGGKQIPYIVVPRCPNLPTLDAWQTLTAVSSHELYEEATDPFKTAWVTVDSEHLGFSLTPPFSEIGDMCIADATEYVVATEIGATVQRAWSNAAAAAGKNPCVPAPSSTPYFAAVPHENDFVAIGDALEGFSGKTKGTHVPVGQTKTIAVSLFSDAPVAPWKVAAYDVAAAEGHAPELALSLDESGGGNGDTLQLSITALKAGEGGGSRYVIMSDDGVHASFWIGYVGN
jgi:hypothetical protein